MSARKQHSFTVSAGALWGRAYIKLSEAQTERAKISSVEDEGESACYAIMLLDHGVPVLRHETSQTARISTSAYSNSFLRIHTEISENRKPW